MMPPAITTRLARVGALPLARQLARRHGASLEELLDTSQRWCVAGRHELWCVVRDTLGLGYAETARLFGADHNSVWHAAQKREARLASLFLRSGGQAGLEGRP